MESENKYIETDLGNVAPNPRGEYDLAAAYEYLDLVEYGGGAYLCIQESGTVTGVAPTQNKNTDTWQVLTIPGDLTPEYIAIHDDVVNKAESAQADAASTAADREQVESMLANVEQLHAQTETAAQEASDSRDSAAGYATAAEASRTAAAESEKNAQLQVTGFDETVSAAKQEATEEIATARKTAVQAVAAQQVKSVNAVNAAGSAAIEKTSADAKDAKDAKEAAMSAANAAEDSAGEATAAAEQAKNDNQSAETAATAAKNSAEAAETAQKAVEGAAGQIETNKKDIAALKGDVASTKGVTDTIDERIIEAFFGSMRNGKVYQTELYLAETNPTSNGIKTLSNKDMVCEPSTDTIEGRDDYEGIGIFSWYNCNYITDDYGRKIPTAIDGWGNGYKNDGSVDVGVIAMTPYWNVAEKDGKQIWTLSDTPNDVYGLIPWETAKKEDDTYASYVIHSKYISGIGTDGLLRSFSGSKPARNQSYNNMIDNYQKKGKGYWGAGKERDMYVILYDVIKYATKNEQTIFKGTTSYSLQYSASVQRNTKETYFPVTNEQASNIIVGSYVSVGYGSKNADDTVNNDRESATIHKYVDDAKIIRIETIDENNKAVYLDIEDGFATAPVALSDTVNAQIVLSTMHWWSGTTDKVIGKHDGSPISNTDGKHPFRVMGIECAVGGYIVYSDSVMVFKEDYSKDVYIAPRGVKHIKDETTIKNTYKLIGNIPGNDGNDFWIGDIGVDVETCSWAAKTIGGSDSQGWGDRCYAGGKNTSGTREDLGRGVLWDRSSAGSVCVSCGNWLGWTSWLYLGCD